MSSSPAPEPAEPRDLARAAARAADGKRAEDIVAIELAGLVAYTDVILLVTARNERQAKAISDGIHETLKGDLGLTPRRIEGRGEGGWLLMDYADVVVHVLSPEARDRYRLESLWAEAPRLELGLEPGGGGGEDDVRRSA